MILKEEEHVFLNLDNQFGFKVELLKIWNIFKRSQIDQMDGLAYSLNLIHVAYDCPISLALLPCSSINLITVFIHFWCIHTKLFLYCVAKYFWIWLIIWCLGFDPDPITPEGEPFRAEEFY